MTGAPGGLLIWVTHLYGIGHLRRAAAIARACRGRGLPVTLVSGGRPLPGLDTGGSELVQLPPLHSPDAGFRQLLGADGRPADADYLAERRQRLLAAFASARPRVVMTEMYPFGRRALRSEAEALLEAALAATPRPQLVASVRDLLVAKPPDKVRWMAEAAQRYDVLLVHGDPSLLRFEESFPFVPALGDRLRYTGYVVTEAGPAPADRRAGAGEVLVSAGGGGFGRKLLETAIAARPLCPTLGALPWRILLGANLPDADGRRLRALAGPGLVVEPARPDFPDLLRRCRLSISQAGVNSVLEGLAAGARALVVPHAEGGETEQAARAARFAERGWLAILDEARLTPEALAEAAEAAVRKAPPRVTINLAGAGHSAEILADLAAIVPSVSGWGEE